MRKILLSIFGQNEAFDFIPCGTERSEVKQGIKSKAELKAKNQIRGIFLILSQIRKLRYYFFNFLRVDLHKTGQKDLKRPKKVKKGQCGLRNGLQSTFLSVLENFSIMKKKIFFHDVARASMKTK